MKNLSIIALLLSLFLISPAIADTITIRADVWCPYNCEPDSEKPGYMIEIVQKNICYFKK